MNIHESKIIEEKESFFVILDEGKKAIVPKKWIRGDGYFNAYICRRANNGRGCSGWQTFDFNSGFEKYAKYHGCWYGNTLQEAIENINE